MKRAIIALVFMSVGFHSFANPCIVNYQNVPTKKGTQDNRIRMREAIRTDEEIAESLKKINNDIKNKPTK